MSLCSRRTWELSAPLPCCEPHLPSASYPGVTALALPPPHKPLSSQHFVCAKCEKPFLGHRHYEKKGLAYCETHYNQVGPEGQSPQGPNLDRWLGAPGRLREVSWGCEQERLWAVPWEPAEGLRPGPYAQA